MCEECGCGQSTSICPECGAGTILIDGETICPSCGAVPHSHGGPDHDHEHEHPHTHNHQHPHAHDHAHEHEHTTDAATKAGGACTEDVDKLRILLPHWIEHNEGHSAGFRTWAHSAREAGLESVAAKIEAAAIQMEACNQVLSTALDDLKGR